MEKVGVLHVSADGRIETKKQKEELKRWRKMQMEDSKRLKKELEAKAICFGDFGKLKLHFGNYFKWSAVFDRKFMKKCMTCPERNMCVALALGIKAIENGQSPKT